MTSARFPLIWTVLGSGTLVPDPERGPAGFLLSHRGAQVLVDGGTGTVQRLARAGVDARTLDAAVYSHRHVDHCLDLVAILFAMRVGPDLPRERDFPVWAGQGFRAFVEGLYGVFGDWIRTERFAVPVHELSLEAADYAQLPAGIRLSTRPANHDGGALHLSFTTPSGPRVVFSGDTGPSQALVELARGADLLVCECGKAPGSDYPHHLSPQEVAELVDAARPRRVLLTHLYPDTDPGEARLTVARTGVPVQWAWDGLRIPLAPSAGH